MNIASNDKRIARNSAVLYIRMFVVMCIQLYISRVILRALGAEDYGIYNVVGGVVTIFSFLMVRWEVPLPDTSPSNLARKISRN